MSISYKPLWKLLIDRELKKKDLMKIANISKSTIDKMGRNQIVSLSIISKICDSLNCDICDVLKYNNKKEDVVYDKTNNY